MAIEAGGLASPAASAKICATLLDRLALISVMCDSIAWKDAQVARSDFTKVSPRLSNVCLLRKSKVSAPCSSLTCNSGLKKFS